MLRVVIALVALCAVASAQPAATVTPPKLVQAVAPEYPAAALAAGKQADVRVRIHIDTAGVVTTVDVVAAVGDGFDEAAVAAAMQYVFEPATSDGKPIAIAVETTIHFVIEHHAAPQPPPVTATTQVAPGPPNHAGPITAPVVLHGVALERGTRRKLAGVIVAIESLGLDTVTATDGTFYFHGVAPGAYTVLAVDPRFERLQRAVELGSHESVEVRLWMRPLGGNPYETVVEGEQDQLEVTKRTLTHDQLTSVPGTFGDPIRAMETLPGIARTPFGLGFLLVRGSDPQDTGIFVDGHEVPALFHFLGGPSIFNAEMIDSLDFYPGGFPGRFGRHHGGVVALETRPTASDGVHGSAKIDALDAGAYLRAPITSDLTFAVAARRSYIDELLPFVLPLFTSSPPSVVAPIYDDYQARVDLNLHDNGRASVFVIGSDDSLHVVDQDPFAVQTQTAALSSTIDFFRVIASYVRPLGDSLRLTISPSWGTDSVTLSGADAATSGPFNSLDVVDHELSYRMRVDGHVSDRVILDTGLDVLSRVTSYAALAANLQNIANPTGINVPASEILRGSEELGVGGYVDLGINVSDRLRLVPSLRLDGYILDGEYRESVDPRLVARYQLDPMWLLKAYAGRFSEPPEPEALDKAFGNPKVGLEHGYQVGVGFEFRPDRVWSFDGELWGVERLDRVVFTNDVQANGSGTFTYINFCNCATEHAAGIEFLIKRQITEKAYGWLSYTFSRSFQSQEGGPWLPTTFDQPHVLNAVASYKPGKGWEVGGRVQLASGRPDTPIIGATFDADLGTYVPVMGTPSSVRDPTFFELDTRVEHTWTFRWWRLGLYLDVLNVLNTQNVEAYEYDYRYRERAPITSYPVLPNLGIRGTW